MTTVTTTSVHRPQDLIHSSLSEAPVKADLISIVIPAYKSRQSLPLLIDKLEAVLNRSGYTFEIIVVDDSSPDDTWEC